jgi:hypothetical protein
MDYIFLSTSPQRKRWIDRAWLAALYLGGLALWGNFLAWGRFPLNFHDWAQITGPRLAFLANALRQGALPLHMPDPSPLGGISDRFLAIPDQMLSPQIILLLFLPAGVFAAGNLLLLYSVGFAGLAWLRRRFSLSLVAFTILFLLFNFNGHILAHLTVGHATWAGYFLFPWFAILVFRLVEGERGWGWTAKMAGLLLMLFLQGAFHQFVWAFIFLALLAVAKRGYTLTAGGGALFGILLSLGRILPLVSLLGQFEAEFYSGYHTLEDLWQALVRIFPAANKTDSILIDTPLSYWEVSLYVGLAGAVFLLYFGGWRWLRGGSERDYRSLALPILGMLVLSMGQIYNLLRSLPIPLLDGERVSTRLISLPFVFICIFAVIYFQEWLDKPGLNRPAAYLVTGAGLLIEMNDLWQNYRTWQVAAAALNFKEKVFDPGVWVLANHADPVYLGLIWGGAALSLASLAALVFFVWREKRGV